MLKMHQIKDQLIIFYSEFWDDFIYFGNNSSISPKPLAAE